MRETTSMRIVIECPEKRKRRACYIIRCLKSIGKIVGRKQCPYCETPRLLDTLQQIIDAEPRPTRIRLCENCHRDLFHEARKQHYEPLLPSEDEPFVSPFVFVGR